MRSVRASFWGELKDAAQRVAPVGGESTGIEIDLADEVDVNKAYWAAACALGGKVVDVRHLYTIEVEFVFARAATTDDDIVAEAGVAGHAGQALDGPADVSVAARVALNFVYADVTQRHWAFHSFAERRRLHHHLFQVLCVFFQASFNLRRSGLSLPEFR